MIGKSQLDWQAIHPFIPSILKEGVSAGGDNPKSKIENPKSFGGGAGHHLRK
jgi:hypothetical protein